MHAHSSHHIHIDTCYDAVCAAELRAYMKTFQCPEVSSNIWILLYRCPRQSSAMEVALRDATSFRDRLLHLGSGHFFDGLGPFHIIVIYFEKGYNYRIAT